VVVIGRSIRRSNYDFPMFMGRMLRPYGWGSVFLGGIVF
jgi:hypothetical protein